MTGAAALQPESNAIEALNRLNEIVTRYCESQMFFAACELGVFERLGGSSASFQDLAQHLQLDPDACHRLLIGLTQMGLLRQNGEHYSNTSISQYLTAQAPVPLEPLSMWGNALFAPIWAHLSDAVREGSARWQQTFGSTQQETFANVYKNPAALRRFCGLMSAYSLPQGQAVAAAYDFTAHQCVLDVAGGPGGMIIEAGRRYPHLRGIVMDLPPVCELADEAIAAAGLNGRFLSRFADLFAGPYPSGADAITLGWVLHDWNDEHCRQILRHCHDALPAGGPLLIVETVLDNDRSGTPFGVLMSLHMLVLCEPGARERTEAEYRKLLAETGFRAERLIHLAAPRDLLIARKI